METTHYYLLYDEDCRLCRWYTSVFIRLGLIATDERVPYHKGLNDSRLQFDRDRARSEIALVNDQGLPARYGLDSLLFVLGQRWKWLEKAARFAPVYFLLRQLYFLISFNRKLISPVVCTTQCACDPPLNKGWRMAYIVCCGLITQWLVGSYFAAYLAEEQRIHFVVLESLLFTLQFGFQFGTFRWLGYRNFWDYAGHIATVSLIGAIVLGILHTGLWLLAWMHIDTTMLQTTSFGLVLGIMLLEHARRMRRLGYSHILTISWFVYRLLLYPFVFNL